MRAFYVLQAKSRNWTQTGASNEPCTKSQVNHFFSIQISFSCIFYFNLKYVPFKFVLSLWHMPIEFQTYDICHFDLLFKQTDFRENVLSWKERDKSGLQFRSLNICGACDCSHHWPFFAVKKYGIEGMDVFKDNVWWYKYLWILSYLFIPMIRKSNKTIWDLLRLYVTEEAVLQ